VNRCFQAKVVKYKKRAYYRNYTVSIPTKFCTVIKISKCLSWVVQTRALQIQDGGRPPSGKNRKITISRPRFGRFRRNLRSSDAISGAKDCKKATKEARLARTRKPEIEIWRKLALMNSRYSTSFSTLIQYMDLSATVWPLKTTSGFGETKIVLASVV